MRRPLRLLKLTLVFLVLIASAMRPVIVFAHNSYNNTVSPVSIAPSHLSAHTVLVKNTPLSKIMRVLDKEKTEAVCLNIFFQKAALLFEPRSFQAINSDPVDSFSFQSTILRI